MADTSPSAKLEIGRVIRQTFGVLGRNFGPLFLMALLLVGVPALIQNLGNPGVLGPILPKGVPLLILVGLLLFLAGYYVLVGALTSATVADLNGRKLDLGECLRVGVRRFWPLLGLTIVTGLAVAVGLFLLIVPGLWLMTVWAVVGPVKVVEDVPFGQTFGRSLALTEGNRGRVTGLLLLYGVFLVLLSALSTALDIAGGVFAAVVTALVQTLNALVAASLTAVLYFELRRVREGVGPESLASVFD